MQSKNWIFLDLADTINKYLRTKDVSEDGKNIITEKPDGTYYPKIRAFERYLFHVKKISDNNQWLYVLSTLKPKDIEESMEFYIDESRRSPNSADHVRKRSVLENFRTVIYEYFKFLSTNDIKNIDLINTFDLWDDDPESFQKIIHRVAKKRDLTDSVKSSEPVSEDDFMFLYVTCDRFMERLSNIDPVKDGLRYNKFVRALIVKLILFTGIKYEVLSSINVHDLDFKYNTICINEYVIHLPNNLRDQFFVYDKFRNIIITKCNSNGKLVQINNLFICNDGSLGKPGSRTDMSSNQFITGFLKSYIGRNDVIGLGKYVIIKMIEKGINQSVIQGFTGYKENIYNYCQNSINKQKSKYDKSRYLDSKLRSIETFDIL